MFGYLAIPMKVSCVRPPSEEEEDHGEDQEDKEEGAGVDTDGDDCKAGESPGNCDKEVDNIVTYKILSHS